ncbi:helix-turn-helix domain-containing protein [uncultured Vagococcus sp.]|uniref:helix-turn-helix domain-containing protein n=1 Tax=uncultured Vagococcus sp. TaxID=189676 RepID=UPI0028D43C35|nr:helix-turn-helix domain-containing protein [uncultured Vagococcus sp.]
MVNLMNKTDFQKLSLLKQAFQTGPNATIDSLAAHLEVSTKTTNRYLTELQADCHSLFPDNQFLLDKQNKSIQITVAPNLSPHYIIDRLHVMYTERSIDYQIIDALLLKKYTNINQLADALFLSPSSLYRILYRLEPFIQKFGMKFSFFDNFDSLNFEYQEKNLRFFSYFFYWSSLKGIHLEPHSSHKKVVQDIDAQIDWQRYGSWLPSKKEQIRYICSITTLRNQQGHSTIDISEEIQEILTIFYSVNDLSTICRVLLEQTDNQLERLFANLFFRLTVSDMDSTDQKETIVQQLLTCDNQIILKAQDMLDLICQHFQLTLSKKDYSYFFFYYILIVLLTEYIDVDLPEDFLEINDLSLSTKNNDQYSNSLIEQATYFVEKTGPIHGITKEHPQYLISLVCMLIDSVKLPALRIAVQYSKNFMGPSIIEKKLISLFGTESIEFTHNQKEADLVISDCFGSTYSDKAYFYMESLTDSLRWEDLFDYIRKQISRRFFQLYPAPIQQGHYF